MAESKAKSEGQDVVATMRQMRDAGMDAWAKSTLRMTSSRPYQKVQGMVMKPTLLATAMIREITESVMALVLSQINMPSRDELLQVSKRLTRIEMTLDDLGAVLDELRRDEKKPGQKQRTAPREREPVRESSDNGNGASAASSASASD